MEQKIKNKQTGETLTGEVINPRDASEYLVFKIAGTTGSHNNLIAEDLEILSPPLPTGIGAVVQRRDQLVFIRVKNTLDHLP